MKRKPKSKVPKKKAGVAEKPSVPQDAGPEMDARQQAAAESLAELLVDMAFKEVLGSDPAAVE